MIEVSCPGCGTVSRFEEMRRDAGEFCRKCDYPLFWARGSLSHGAGDEGEGAGLRRLPGTAGRVEVASLTCPQCDEPNTMTAAVCVRCGADLHARPEPEPEPAPEPVAPPPPPEPEPEPRRLPWWVIAAVLVTVALLVFVIVASLA